MNGTTQQADDAGIAIAEVAPPIVPPDYRALRTVADLAQATPGAPMEFTVVHGAVARSPALRPPSDTRVQIPTRSTGRVGALEYVSCQAKGAAGAFDVLTVGADAVFWSESSVEKFLVPYVASAAAWDAGEVVSRLQKAFYTAWKNVDVVALLRRADFPVEVPARLEETLGVVFVDLAHGSLRELPLPAFLDLAKPGQGSDPLTPSITLEAGALTMDPPFLPTATQLRGIAEWASSLRTTPMYFLFNVATGEHRAPRPTLPPVLSDEIVIPAYTPPRLANRTAPRGLWLQPRGPSSPVDVAETGDAAFWSTGAVETFLFPYYASAAGVNALEELQALHDAWEKGTLRTEAEEGTEVYAIIHLPKSNWVAESETTMQAVGALGVMYRDSRAASKDTHVASFTDFATRPAS